MVERHKRPKKIRDITQRLLLMADIRDSIKFILNNNQLSEEATKELQELHDDHQRWIDENMDELDKVVRRGKMTYQELRCKHKQEQNINLY